MNSFDLASEAIAGSSPNALSAEPYATLANGGPVPEHDLPTLFGLTLHEIRLLRNLRLFPKSRGSADARYSNRKQVIAYLWGLEHSPKLARRVETALGYRKSNWAKD